MGKHREHNGMSSGFIKNGCGQVSLISFYNTVNILVNRRQTVRPRLRKPATGWMQRVEPGSSYRISSQWLSAIHSHRRWIDQDIFYMDLFLNLHKFFIINQDTIKSAENPNERTLEERINISNVLEKQTQQTSKIDLNFNNSNWNAIYIVGRIKHSN